METNLNLTKLSEQWFFKSVLIWDIYIGNILFLKCNMNTNWELKKTLYNYSIVQMEDGPNGKRSHKYVLVWKYTVQYTTTSYVRYTILMYGISTEP